MKFYIPSVRLISNEFESKSYENSTNYNFEKTIESKHELLSIIQNFK